MGIIIALAIVAYLVLLVDWKELIGALGQGGWPAIILYGALAFMIVTILLNPDIPHIAPAGHH